MLQEGKGNRGIIIVGFDAMKNSQSFRPPVNLVFLAT